VALRGDRSIRLQHGQQDRVPLDENDAREVIKHFHSLWQFDVHLEALNGDDLARVYHCNDEKVWMDNESAPAKTGETRRP
jgi:spore cortex formation protein SpoVR/YcgB (stage V sporulation)